MPPDEFDVERARAETPSCENLVHLNNAGASLTPQPVWDAYLQVLRREALIGSYETGEELQATGQGLHRSAARLVNCQKEDIAFFDSATRGWNSLVHSAVLGLGIGPGDRVLVSASEYVNNYMALLQLSARHGFTIDAVECDEDGALSLDSLASMIGGHVKLITLTHAPANSGLMNPVIGVGAMAKAHGIPFMLDVAQTAGQVPLDVEALGCQMLVATGRKFLRGPRGTAFAYIAPSLLDQLEVPTISNTTATLSPDAEILVSGGAERFEIWEANIAARHALGCAIDYAMEWGLDNIRARVDHLARQLRTKLGGIKGIELTDQGIERCGIVCMKVRNKDPYDVLNRLRAENINAAVIRPEQTFLDSQKRSLPPLLRASVHYYNTESELDVFCETLERMIR
jgi:cysteine desulfurase/selenocysteine lyase